MNTQKHYFKKVK